MSSIAILSVLGIALWLLSGLTASFEILHDLWSRGFLHFFRTFYLHHRRWVAVSTLEIMVVVAVVIMGILSLAGHVENMIYDSWFDLLIASLMIRAFLSSSIALLMFSSVVGLIPEKRTERVRDA